MGVRYVKTNVAEYYEVYDMQEGATVFASLFRFERDEVLQTLNEEDEDGDSV